MTGTKIIKDFFLGRKHYYILGILLLVNLLIRLLIYYNTTLFYFSDYSTYLKAVDKIAAGEKIYILSGNFYYTISYLGNFFKYVLGSIDYFFIFNCLLGTLTSLIMYILVVKVTAVPAAGLLTVLIHTLYTEYMVFSSVFYTPVLMIFLLSLFVLLLYFYYTSNNYSHLVISLILLSIIFSLTFFFKPELLYLPLFLIVPFLIFVYRREKPAAIKTLILILLLFTSHYSLSHSNLISQPPGNTISNAFVMFGHTDYGGDGGEGSFVYKRNQQRYETALMEYSKSRNIVLSNVKDYNNFRTQEIRNFIVDHPFEWIGIQLTKFFRTFGIVPESNSFKVLYTGLFNNKLWIASVFVVAPVALILLLFISFFNYSAIKNLFYNNPMPEEHFYLKMQPVTSESQYNVLTDRSVFFIIYFVLFLYYLIATTFFGHYQERYRLPVMVVFIIPGLAYFIGSFDKRQFFKSKGLILKSTVIVLFLSIWVFQAKKAVNNKERLVNAIESVGGSLDKIKK